MSNTPGALIAMSGGVDSTVAAWASRWTARLPLT